MDKPVKKAKAKKVKKDLKRLSESREEVIRIREKRHMIEISIIIVIAGIFLILLCNKTFFKDTYIKDNMNIELPMFMFYAKDNEGELQLVTLRKSEYVKEYFDNYLMTLDKYSCKSGDFFYDTINKLAIFDIDVEKKLALKTVKINYQTGEPDDLCKSDESFIIVDNKLEAAIPGE